MSQTKHVALLRGINVGGKRKIPMARLAELFGGAGCTGVKTYLQSGNVIFDAPASVLKNLPSTVAALIAKEFGYTVAVLMRSAKELEDVVKNNPFVRRGMDASILHVAFLADVPDPKRLGELHPTRSRGDLFEAHGRQIYLCLPLGVARTKLTNDYFDRTLGTVSTLRNWNTVQKLWEIVSRDH